MPPFTIVAGNPARIVRALTPEERHADIAKGKIIVFGILFWYPLAGVTYQFLHYLIALRRLGYDVVLRRRFRALDLRSAAQRSFARRDARTSRRLCPCSNSMGLPIAGRFAANIRAAAATE